LAEHFNPKIEKALLIGGGAYVFPRVFLAENPSSSIDIVELDPKLTQIAKDKFFLKEDPRITIYHQDGRTYLNKNTKKYDAVYIDAFTDLVLPFHLTTLEATNRIFSSLDEDGLLVTNIISALKGEKGKIFESIYLTYKTVFPQVFVFPVNYPDNPNRVQNIVLIATKEGKIKTFDTENQEYTEYLHNLWDNNVASNINILTDDFSPIDYYYLSVGDSIFRKN
jgi:spermidine synthase